MKFFYTLSIFTVLSYACFGQALSTYNLSFPAGTYTAIAGTVPARTALGGASSGGWDDASCSGIPIGFNFTYVGVVYTTISANTNGFAVLGNAISTALTTVSYQNDLSNALANNEPRPIIAPSWDDLYVTANPLQYSTTGVVGSRVFTLQWTGMDYYANSGGGTPTPTLDIQIKLYEGSNVIDFIYKQLTTFNCSSGIGITDGNGASVAGAVNYWSLANSSAAPTRTMTTDVENIGTQPATDQIYRWSPCPVIATPTSNSPVCAGGTLIFTGTTTGGSTAYTWTGPVSYTSTLQNPTITGVTVAQTGTYSFTATNGTCSVTATTNVVVTAIPTTITGTPNVCVGLTSTLSDAAPGGTWTSSNTTIAVIDTTTGIVTGAAAGTAVITYSNLCGTVTTSVIVNPNPGVVAGAPNLCPGSTITLSDATTGGTWSSSNSTAATVDVNTGVVYGASTGTTTISYTISGGCAATRVITIDAGPPASTITPSSATFCTGSQMLTAPAIPATSVTTTYPYTGAAYNIPDNTAAGRNRAIAVTGIPGGATIADVSVTLINVPMRADNQLTFNIQAPDGNNLNLVNREGGGTNQNFANTVVSSLGVATLGAAVAPFTGTYKADAAAGIGPTGATSNVTTWPPLYTTPNGNWILCARDWVNRIAGRVNGWSLTIHYTTPTGGYTWAPTTGLFTNAGLTIPYAGGTTNTVYASPGSTTTYTATASIPGYTCTSSSTATITIAGLAGGITGTTTICQGTTTTLSTSVTGGVWSSSNSSVATVNSTGVVSGSTAGSTVISYTNGCTATTTVTVTAAPTAISGGPTVCPGTTITLSDGIAGGTWTSGTLSQATVVTGPSATTTVTGVSPGGGTSVITYTLGSGCSKNITITVNPSLAAITGTTSLCAGTTTTLSETVAGTWSSATSSVATITSGGGVLSAVSAGTSVITFTSSATGCTTTISVTVLTTPVAITGGPAGVCAGSTITLSDATPGGTWTSSLTGIATVVTGPASTTTVTGVTGGSSSVITYWLNGGCNITTLVTVVAAPPAPTGLTSVCVGSSITLSDASSGTWSSGTGIVATVTPGPIGGGVVWGAGAGTEVIIFTSSTLACTSVITVTVTAVPGPITGLASVCAGLTIPLSDNVGGGTWTSGTPAVATVTPGPSAATTVTGVSGLGTTLITYSNGCGSPVFTVTVIPSPGTITGIPIVCTGSTTTLSNPAAGGTWSSGTPAVGTVTTGPGAGAGVVSGVTSGTTQITYATGCGSAAITTVTVNAAPTIISGPAIICLGGTTTLSNNGSPTGTWSSSNSAVATIDPVTGVVSSSPTGVFGTTIIDVTNLCGSTNILFTVSSPTAISGVTSICQNAVAVLSNGVGGGVWSSSNSAVATTNTVGVPGLINGSGIGTAAGITTITYTLSTGCYVTFGLTTTSSPTAINGLYNVCVGSVTNLTDFTPGGVWTSSSGGVATVGTGGDVHGVGPGTTRIDYSIGTCAASATVTVAAPPTAIIVPGAVCVHATITLSDATPIGGWSSSNSGVATIDPGTGVVSGVSAGSTTITYELLLSGCYTTSVVTVNPLPTTILGGTTICAGQTTSLSDATTGGSWTSGTPGIAPISTSGVVTGLAGAGGTSVITYTLPATGCYTTTVVTVNPLPGSIIGVTTLCTGTSTPLTDAPGGGTWTSSNGGVAGIGLNSGVVNALTPGTTGITYTLGTTGCTNSVVVTVNQTPVAITGNTTICAGLTTQLTDATGGGLWSSGTISVATVVSTTGVVTGNINIPSQGTTIITYTRAGCAAQITVTVNPLPLPISGTDTVCAGLTTQLSDPTSGGVWSSSVSSTATITTPGGLVTGGNVFPSSLNTGITYTLGTGCITTTTVTVNPLPTVITGNTTICAGLTTQLSDGVSGGVWSNNNTNITISGTGLVTGTLVGTQSTSTVTYTLGTGCIMTTVVTVNPLPLPITGTDTICAGLTTQLSDPTAGGVWSSSVSSTATISTPGGLVTGGNVFPTALHTGITYTLGTGCITTTTITVNPLPTAITGNTTICAGLTTQLSNGVGGGVWSSNTTAIRISGTGLVTGSPVSTQSTATVTYTLGSGCIQTTTITVNPLPLPIIGSDTICAGLTTQLSDPTSGGVWSSSVPSTAVITAGPIGGGLVTGGLVGTTLHTTITYTLPTTCLVTTTVTVNPLPGAISGATSLCQGTTIYLSDPTTGGTWSSSNIGLATVVGASSTATLTATAAGGAVGVDTITYTLGTGCIATKTVTINVQPAPITGGPLNLCQGAGGTLSDATGGGVWTSANTHVAIVNPVTGAVTGVGTISTIASTTIIYTIGSCSQSTLVFVNPQPGPITGTTTMCNGVSVTLSDAVPGGVWSASNTSVTIGAGTGIVVPNTPGIDTITNTIGICIATTTVVVNVQPVVIAGPASFCDSSSVTLSDATPGGIWSSSNANASVGSLTGIVTGTMPLGSPTGTAIITYTEVIGGCFITKLETIHTQPVLITGVTSVCIGNTTSLTDLTTGGVWSTVTTSIVSVGSTGIVTGLSTGTGGGNGTGIIIYTIGTCSVSDTVTVHPLPSPVSGIFYICQFSSTTLGDLTAGGTWSSSAPAIASINPSSGVVSGLTIGHADITYTLPTGCITTQTVDVIAIPGPIIGISSICAGTSLSLSDTSGGGAWISSNTNIATISTSGVVTGNASGTVVITYTLGTGCRTLSPVVVNPLSPITGIMSVCVGQHTNLSDTTVGGTWSSSNNLIATVNSAGVVTGARLGTVTITYNLPTGCSAIATVTVNALPSPITGPTPLRVCDGGATITLSDATGGGVWTSANTNVATIDAAGVLTGSGNTTTSAATVTITYTSGCFITTTVTVNPLPGTIQGNTTVCVGLTTALSDVTPTGTWSSINSSIATVDPLSGVVSASSAGTATIVYTLPTGCSAATLITVNPLPPAITGPSAVCVNSCIALSDSITGGAWFGTPAGVASTGFLTGQVCGIGAGTAVITYEIVTGCITTHTVMVNPLPTAIGGRLSICAGTLDTLYSGTGGTWTSSVPGVATIDSVSGIVTAISTGTTIIGYTIATGCSATAVLTVNPLPSVISGNTTVCTGMTTDLSDATPGGVWSSSNTFLATVDPSSGVVSGIIPGTPITITYTLPTGCSISTPVSISVPPTTIGGPSIVCIGATITLNDGVTPGVWSSSNSTAATVDPSTGMVSGANAGFTIITYRVGGGACFQTHAVTVNPLPAAITGTLAVCVGLTTDLTDATGGGTWSSISTPVATIGVTSGVATGVTAGTSVISYTLASTGCAATATLTVNRLPDSITGNTNICYQGSETLSDSYGTGTWSSSNIAVTTVGLNTGVVYGNSVGVDTITYTLSTTGCIMTTTVAVHPLPLIYTVTGGGSYCSGGSGVHIGLSGSQIGVNYLLYLGATPTGTFAGTGGAIDFGAQLTAGTYTVEAVNTFTTCSNGMSGSAVIIVNASPVPTVNMVVVPGDTVCAGVAVSYTATVTNSGSSPTYQWSVNGTNVATGTTYNFIPANGDRVVVLMTSNAQCASPMVVGDTVIMDVLAPGTPSVGVLISPNDTVCAGTAVTLTAILTTADGTTPSYLWYVNSGYVGGGSSYTYTPTDGDIIYCNVVSDYRCRLSDTGFGAHEVISVQTPVTPVVSIVTNPGWALTQGAADTLYAIVTNGGSSPTYQWFVNGVPVTGATSSMFVDNSLSFAREDSIGCQVTGSGYCRESAFAWIYILTEASGVTQVKPGTGDIIVIPNPNTGTFTVKGTLGTTANEEVSLEMTDVIGQSVYKSKVIAKGGVLNKVIDLGNTLANGMYVLSVRSETETKVFHVVIEQ